MVLTSGQVVEFLLQFPESLQTADIQIARLDRRLNGTSRFGLMLTIPEMASLGECFNVVEGLLRMVIARPHLNLSHARCVDNSSAAGKENKVTPRCRMPSLGIALPDSGNLLSFSTQ